MSLRDWWDLLGFRGVLALVVLVVLTGVGISGWITDGWLTGVPIIIGAISAAVAIVAYGRAIILDAFLGMAATALTLFGFFQYLSDSHRHAKESMEAFDKAYAACARGDSKVCDEGVTLMICKYVESHQDLMRAATSANINIHVPKEISGVLDMSAQRDINLLPSDCRKKQ